MMPRLRPVGALCFVLAVASGTLAAQSRTGEFRLIGLGAYAPAVSGTVENPDQIGPPEKSGMAGGLVDISFRAGRLALGPEGSVLRGPNRRVWSLGGIARYELGVGAIRPFGLLGGGLYFWDREYTPSFPPGNDPPESTWGSDVNVLSLSLGGGLILGGVGSRVSAVVEGRYHHNLNEDDLNKGSRAMLSLGLGARIAW